MGTRNRSTPRSLGTALRRASAWFNEMAESGMDVRAAAALKAEHDAREFADAERAVRATNPMLATEYEQWLDHLLEEGADVVMCVVAALQKRGMEVSDLARAIEAKVEANRTRAWRRSADGTYDHVEA